MQPLAVVLNIAIVVGIVGIVVYWVRRFAVFRGYKAIEPDVLHVAEVLKSQAFREGSDVVVEGDYRGSPTIVRFSNRVDRPGLHIQMRVPTALNFTVLPKSVSLDGQGRVLMRTSNAQLDRRFNARSDQPMEVSMLLGTSQAMASLEQLCCSTQTGFSLKDRVMELSELTIPTFAAKHVLEHLEDLGTIARRVQDMPGASEIKVEPLPQRGSSLTVRVALAFGLVCLLILLFLQPYNRPSGLAILGSGAHGSGVAPADAARMSRLAGWHVMGADDFSGAAPSFLRQHGLPLSGHVSADFSGSGAAADSAYLLVDAQGQRRVSMIVRRVLTYDVIFPRAEALARIPKSRLAKIQWKTAPQFAPDGDGLLVIQNAEDPTASLVLLRHGAQTFSARPADFTQIDLAPQ